MKNLFRIENVARGLCLFAGVFANAELLAQQDLLATQPAAVYTSAVRYESGQVVGTISPDPDGAGSLHFLATRNTYNSTTALLEKVEKGELSSWQDQTVKPRNWGGAFIVISSKIFTYDQYGRKATEKTLDIAGTTKALVEYNYDGQNHVLCKAVRMTLVATGDACSSANLSGTNPDRITRYTTDRYDQVVKEERAVGVTGIEQTYVINTYTGRLLTNLVDANGNKTDLYYDAHRRLKRMVYPTSTRVANQSPLNPGVANGTETGTSGDYVEFQYDANGNKISERKRNGAVINYQFDKLNRKIVKDLADNTQDVYFDYDLRGLMTLASFGPSTTGQRVNNKFDGFGNFVTGSIFMGGVERAVYSQYDLNNNRTRVSRDGLYFTYTFDGLNRLDTLFEASDTKMVRVVYGNDGRRKKIERRGDFANTTYAYADGLRLNSLTQDFPNTVNDLTNSFQYNYAGQISRLTLGNTLYYYRGNENRTGAYAVNGLNEYTSIDGQPLGHDLNANLINDGFSTYTYDNENRLLTTSSATATSNFVYDPLGRLFQVTIGTNKREFLYDGDALVSEYDGSTGALKHHYVHGDQVDEPLVQFNTIVSGIANWRYLHADHQGSIIAHSDVNGNVLSTLAYDSYGIPDAKNTDRFGYTGQIWFKELGLYHYKARIYNPKLGRFLQTDPIGYKDSMNMYAYVGNDPMNLVDHSGQYAELSWTSATSVTLTIPYTLAGERPAFSNVALEAQVAKDFSGTFNVNGSNVSITAQAVAVSGTQNTNTITVHSRTEGVTQSGRAETNSVGGNKITMGANDSVLVGSHELGHAAGAGDQYAGGTGANGQTLSADVPGNPNIMRDLGGGANNQTAGEILGASTNTNNSANGMSGGNVHICSGMGAEAGGCR